MPARIAGRDSGSVTRQKVWAPLPPRSRPASSKLSWIRSSDAYSGKIMNGM